MDPGVPKLFHRTAAERPGAAGLWADVGEAMPRASRSPRPAVACSSDRGESLDGEAVAVPGSWLRPATRTVAVATPMSRMDVVGMMPPQGRSTGCGRGEMSQH